MILHRILRGPNAGLYLPFAEARLRELTTLWPHGVFTQKYKLPGYDIEVQQEPPFQYIRIKTSGEIYFEFLTNGLPLERMNATQQGQTFPAYKAAAVGITLGNDKIPRPFIVRQEKVAPGQPIGRMNRRAQADLMDEPSRNLPGGYHLFESFAPVHPHTGIYSRHINNGDSEGENTWTRMRDIGYGRGMLSAFSSRDFGIDVPFEYAVGGGTVKDAFLPDGDGPTGKGDWPRASGIQTVTDLIFGTRRFGISIDAFGQFHVFPLTAIEPLHADPYEQNVPKTAVQTKKPTFPAWAYVPSQKLKDFEHNVGTANSFVAAPDLDWKTSPDGTKACVVVYERVPCVFDFARFTTASTQASSMHLDYYHSTSFGYGQSTFDEYTALASGVDRRHNTSVGSWFSYPTVYHTAPGLLEVTIEITITGSELANFRVELKTEIIRRPTDTPFCTMLAGYSGVDVKADDWTADNKKFKAKAGDLMVLDIERWWNPEQMRHDCLPGDYGVWPLRADGALYRRVGDAAFMLDNADDEEFRRPYRSFMVLKNLTQALELRAFSGACVIDYDFDTLSFAMLERKDVWDYTQYNTWSSEAVRFRLGFGFEGNLSSGGPDYADVTMDPYRNTIPGGTPWKFKVKTLVRHIAVSVWTLNEFREVLFPEAMAAPIKLDMLAATAVSPRDYIAAGTGYVFMPLNDLRPWGDSLDQNFQIREAIVCGDGYEGFGGDSTFRGEFGRSYGLLPIGYTNQNAGGSYFRFLHWSYYHNMFYTGFGTGYMVGFSWYLPSSPEYDVISQGGLNPINYTHTWILPVWVNWMRYGARMYGGNREHAYLTEPRWGWGIYADEIMNRNMCAPTSTFFAHHNGSWAFYSAQFIYNRNPMMIDGVLDEWMYKGEMSIGPGHATGRDDDLGGFVGRPDPHFQQPNIWTCVNTLEAFNPEGLEHCLFDRVHLVTPDGKNGVDTTFVALYNEAQAKLPTPEDGGPNLEKIELVDIRAVFTKEISGYDSLGWYASGIWNIHPQQPPPSLHDLLHQFPDAHFDTLDLKVKWQDTTVYYRDRGYFNMTTEGMTGSDYGFLRDGTIPTSTMWANLPGVYVYSPNFGGHGLVDLTMGTTFTTGRHHTGQFRIPDLQVDHTHFSSCVMVP